MRMGQAPYNSDFTRFMTGEAGPSELPDQSRVPFSCYLEEHVRYSKRDERDDPCHIPLFPPIHEPRDRAGGVEVVQYRDQILPLMFLSEILEERRLRNCLQEERRCAFWGATQNASNILRIRARRQSLLT